ncbi:MAG: trigger factor [Spirochaeta sp. LUC14_002_19_P3]|nr:MAG: trigger factor [Spirochaeta sp. LUC14_002_19_P3]
MIENKQFEKLENSRVKLTITVSADKTQSAYDDIVKEYIRQVQLPGFRKGKVPQEIIIRKFGQDINHSAMAELIDNSSKEVLKDIEDDYSPVSNPEAGELDPMEPGKPYIFSIFYDIYPQVVHGEYRSMELKKPQVQISKKHVDEKLEELREQNANIIEKEDGLVSSGTVVTMDYAELDDNGKVLEDTHRKGFTFTVGKKNHPYGIEADIEGMKAGEERTIVKTCDEEASPELAGRTIHLYTAIKTVKERQLPELDDEFAQDVSDEFKTLNDLIEKIKSELEKSAEGKLKENMFDSVAEKLLEGADFQLPQSMVNAEQRKYLNDLSRSAESLEEESLRDSLRPLAERTVKLRLIYSKIVNDEGINVSDEEVQNIINEQANMYNIKPEDYLRNFGGERMRSYIRDQQVYNKLKDFLLNSAVVSPGETVDYNDL